MHDTPPPARRPRGRPRIHPLSDPNAPKRPRGRPTKEAAAAAAAAIQAAARAYPALSPTPAPAIAANTLAFAPKLSKSPKPPKRTLAKLQFATPGRAAMSRHYQYEVLFLDQFHDPDPTRRFLSLNDLARKFDYSRSTVWRDLLYLSAYHGLPIEYIPERGGWGYTKLPPRISGIWMEEGDLLVLAASWGALEGRRGSDFTPKVRKVMEKLMNALGHDLSFDFKTVSERIAFRSSGYHSAIDVATFETVISAVLSQCELTFTYRKLTPGPDGAAPGPATRLVQPRCMICVDHSAWYIFADDPAHPDEEPHIFALFRMSDVADTGRKFEPGKPFDLEAVLLDSLGIHRGGPRKTVELLFDPEVAGYVQEHFWHVTEQFGIADDGRLLLTMRVAINPELEGKIRIWTPNVEVIGPPELRDRFKQHAAKEYARYH
jgi:predicted DNA-binding transcriptional regulator YafY